MLTASRSAYIAQGDNMPVRSSLFQPNALRTVARISATGLTIAVITACAADRTEPTGLNPSVGASSNGLPFTEGLASPGWQKTDRDYVGVAQFIPVRGGHAYALLSV